MVPARAVGPVTHARWLPLQPGGGVSQSVVGENPAPAEERIESNDIGVAAHGRLPDHVAATLVCAKASSTAL